MLKDRTATRSLRREEGGGWGPLFKALNSSPMPNQSCPVSRPEALGSSFLFSFHFHSAQAPSPKKKLFYVSSMAVGW
jgi:hypothetical protein